MTKMNTDGQAASRIVWEELEGYVRERVQGLVQELLEDEVTEFLQRQKYERKKEVDPAPGYRNGYGKPRRLTMCGGTITVRRPRIRDAEMRFVSRLLPLFSRRTLAVDEMLPELYLHGLALGDFDLALRGVLGEDAPISPQTISRLKEKWQQEYEEWNSSSLEHLEPVYIWADGIYVKAGLEKEKAALLVVIAGLKDGSKVILAIEAGYRESTASWSDVLRKLVARGMIAPKAVVADGNLGIWGAVANVFPEAKEQRCWNHRMINILDRFPYRLQKAAKKELRKVVYAESREQAEEQKAAFQHWCDKCGYGEVGRRLDQDWERLVTFYDFPKEHWIHLRTTNIVESPFSLVRLRTTAARRFKKTENATGVIWKMLLVAESRFRKLNAAVRLEEVFDGVEFVNGERKTDRKKEAAA